MKWHRIENETELSVCFTLSMFLVCYLIAKLTNICFIATNNIKNIIRKWKSWALPQIPIDKCTYTLWLSSSFDCFVLAVAVVIVASVVAVVSIRNFKCSFSFGFFSLVSIEFLLSNFYHCALSVSVPVYPLKRMLSIRYSKGSTKFWVFENWLHC